MKSWLTARVAARAAARLNQHRAWTARTIQNVRPGSWLRVTGSAISVTNRKFAILWGPKPNQTEDMRILTEIIQNESNQIENNTHESPPMSCLQFRPKINRPGQADNWDGSISFRVFICFKDPVTCPIVFHATCMTRWSLLDYRMTSVGTHGLFCDALLQECMITFFWKPLVVR